jgi:hypothetical protein
MMTIFGNGLATGKYVMGSNEALGTPSECVGTSIKAKVVDLDNTAKTIDDVGKLWEEATKDATEVTNVGAGVGSKRKRTVLGEEDVVLMSSMTEALKDVASAIRETKVEIMHPDLYGAVMYMPGFPHEALIVAYSHLLDNKPQRDAFVKMSEAHRVLWLRTWLAKHYYM